MKVFSKDAQMQITLCEALTMLVTDNPRNRVEVAEPNSDPNAAATDTTIVCEVPLAV